MLDNFPSTSLRHLVFTPIKSFNSESGSFSDILTNLKNKRLISDLNNVQNVQLKNFLGEQTLVSYGMWSSCKMSIESSKGIYSIFINSMLPFSSDRAFTVNVIANDFLAITQLNKVCKSINLADLIAVLGSVDFVLGSVDLIFLFFIVFIREDN